MSRWRATWGVAALGRTLRLRFVAHAALLGLIVVVAVVAALRAPLFLTHDNLIEIFRATSTYLIVACALAMVMIAGGLDFSVGATFSVGAVVACGLMTHGVMWPLAVVLGLAAGATTGFVGGAIVVYFRVPPMIATLSVFFVATGLIDVFVKGLIAPLPGGFLQIGQGELLGVPLLVWYAAGVSVLSWTLLEKTSFGYALRAVGGNRDAAHASGIRVRRLDLTVYAVCGCAAALAGILYAARTSAGQPDAGGYLVTLQVITAVLVGGVSLSGGVGSIGGVALGSVLFGELQNALGVAGFDPVWSDVFTGTILALAVALDGLRRRRRFLEVPVQRTAGPVARQELERVMSGRSRVEAARMMAAVNTERKRIERDLHDGAQQRLVAMAMWCDVLQANFADAGAVRAREVIERMSRELDGAIADLREITSSGTPVSLIEEGLDAALAALVERTPGTVVMQGSAGSGVPPSVAAAGYFAAAEGLTNAIRHSRARQVELAVRREPDRLRIEVRDDGIGGAQMDRGSGLRGLRDRLAEHDGCLSLQSPPGGGTVLAIDLPAPES